MITAKPIVMAIANSRDQQYHKPEHMKHLTILVPDGENNLSSIVGAYKIFTRANAYRKETGKREVFKIELAGHFKKSGVLRRFVLL